MGLSVGAVDGGIAMQLRCDGTHANLEQKIYRGDNVHELIVRAQAEGWKLFIYRNHTLAHLGPCCSGKEPRK